MGECSSYPRLPNMAPDNQAARLSVYLDCPARYFEQGDPAPAEQTPAAPSVRRVYP